MRLDSSASLPATALLRRIDEVTGNVGESEPLGELPIEELRLEEGHYRVVVVFDDGRFAELTRYLDRETTTEIVAREPPVDLRDGMVEIDLKGEPFRPWLRPTSLCPNLRHEAELAPFLIDVAEVSNAQYRAFLDATGRDLPRRWQALESWDPAWDDLPVMGIPWGDAQAYAEWVGKRLPTHSEWELAVRGPDGLRYPWGETADPARGRTWTQDTPIAFPDGLDAVAYDREMFSRYAASTARVLEPLGDVSPFGLLHGLGNVDEFTETMVVQPSEQGPRIDTQARYVMGGSWKQTQAECDLTSHKSWGISSAHKTEWRGFRCARSLSP